uniref:Uncharacterized protein n=1 Tax=Arundo donax TaxID=35708 RepID=A0A0A9BJC9_ARUDO
MNNEFFMAHSSKQTSLLQIITLYNYKNWKMGISS